MNHTGPASKRAFIGLGANLGDPQATLAAALREIAALPGTTVHATSATYRSAPVDAQGPDFYNAVVEVDTLLAAPALLRHLQAIEQSHGRLRPYRNAPRTLDLDLLLHGDTVMDTPDLRLPHPRLHLRAFVLQPLAELAPGLVIPGHGALLALLPAVSHQAIKRLSAP
jgi:2-amino-4-hydroxy-6-hydroxymethyldihydropteridine diphosphokinase